MSCQLHFRNRHDILSYPNCFHKRGQRKWPDGSFLTISSHTTLVVHLVCSTISCRDFEPARDKPRLCLRPANFRWSGGATARSARYGLWPSACGTTLIEPWRIFSYWVCDSSVEQQKRDAHGPPLGALVVDFFWHACVGCYCKV